MAEKCGIANSLDTMLRDRVVYVVYAMIRFKDYYWLKRISLLKKMQGMCFAHEVAAGSLAMIKESSNVSTHDGVVYKVQ